jgi:hypothetical protein
VFDLVRQSTEVLRSRTLTLRQEANGSVNMKLVAVPLRSYSSSTRLGRPG